MTTTLEPITITESKRFRECECVIREGQEQWLAVGIALTEIRDCKYYRSDFETFKEYCEQTWGWTDKRAYQLISAAEESSTSGRTFATERQARESRRARQPKQVSPAAEPLEETPHITTAAQDEDSAPSVESSPALSDEPDAATEVVQIIEAAITEADKEVLNRISVYCVTVPRKIKDAIRMRKL